MTEMRFQPAECGTFNPQNVERVQLKAMSTGQMERIRPWGVAA